MNDNNDNGVEQQKRAYPRVGFSRLVKIVVPDDDTAIDVVASNVSRDGIFLKTNHPLGKGKKMTLEFDIENEKIRVDEGEVVWTKGSDEDQLDESGMGVRFNSLSEGSRRKIESFIQEELKKKPSQAGDFGARLALRTKPGALARADDDRSGFFDERLAGAFASDRPLDSTEDGDILGPSEWGSGLSRRGEDTDMAMDTGGLGNQGGIHMRSKAAPARSRWFLFGVFVLIVAVVTFLTLYMIKPIGKSSGNKLMTSVPENQAAEASPPEKETAAADANPPEQVKAPIQDNQTAPKQDTTASKPADASVGKAQSGEKQTIDPPPAAVDAAGLSIQDPEFKRTSQGWQMVVQATADMQVKHFELKSPPRLVVDFEKAEYAGSTTSFENPMPAVLRVRVGEDPSHTRIVIDFKGSLIPSYRLDIQKKVLRVNF